MLGTRLAALAGGGLERGKLLRRLRRPRPLRFQRRGQRRPRLLRRRPRRLLLLQPAQPILPELWPARRSLGEFSGMGGMEEYS